MKRCKLIVVICLFVFSQNTGKAMQGAVFPFCAEAGSLESARLNNFHLFFNDLNNTIAIKEFTLKVFDRNNVDCDIQKKRNLALVNNSERFLSASYLIEGDSVSINYLMLYSKVLDKTVSKQQFKGLLSKSNDLLKKLLSKIFSDFDVHLTPKHWETVYLQLNKDEKSYNSSDNGSNSGENFYEMGKIAYEAANYDVATATLEKVSSTDVNYPNALYLMGKTYLHSNNFNAALDFFTRAKSKNSTANDLNLYIESCKKLVKPNVWYDSKVKRSTWWNSLNSVDLAAMLQLMNNLKINNKFFDNSYTFEDEDIVKLLQTRSLVCKNMKLNNFSCFSILSAVDVLIIDNTKFVSNDGIDKLLNLKIIRSNVAGIDKGQIKEFIKNQKIKLINVQ